MIHYSHLIDLCLQSIYVDSKLDNEVLLVIIVKEEIIFLIKTKCYFCVKLREFFFLSELLTIKYSV